MTTFDDREQAFEKKFAHDAEMQFKAAARRDKKLGLWAGEKMGLAGDELEAYAKTVVIADLEEPGDEDVYRKVSADLTAKGVSFEENELRNKMAQLLSEAKAEILEE
ncbi:MAG: DUF1476 domain-containing protein [Neomegalonema sp.]|nr:DUF1476 domain-containing protein [Neomegalonema sp.]